MVDEITDICAQDSGFDEAFKGMARMYKEARRKAMGVEKVLDDLLSELED